MSALQHKVKKMVEQPSGVAAADERIQRQSALRRAFVRPELGAMTGTVLVFVYFALVAGGTGMFAADGIMNWGSSPPSSSSSRSAPAFS